jgi:hypothetical protein
MGGWSGELHNFYFSPDVIRMIKEDEMGMECSTRVRRGMRTGFWCESRTERAH